MTFKTVQDMPYLWVRTEAAKSISGSLSWNPFVVHGGELRFDEAILAKKREATLVDACDDELDFSWLVDVDFLLATEANTGPEISEDDRRQHEVDWGQFGCCHFDLRWQKAMVFMIQFLSEKSESLPGRPVTCEELALLIRQSYPRADTAYISENN